jgi:hypothetical protein
MLWLGISLFVLGAVFFVVMGVLWYLRTKCEYEQEFHALCPETMQPVDIRVDAALAAKSQFKGREELKVVACSRWPEKQGCDQACTPQVELLGDSRVEQEHPAFGLRWEQLKKNNPVRMTPELYVKMARQLKARKRAS